MAAITLRKGLIALLGMAVAVAFVGGMLVLVLNTGSGTEEAAPPPTVPTTQAPPDETTGDSEVPATTVDGGGRSEFASGEDGYYGDREEPEFIPLPPMGIADANFSWTVTELLTSRGGESWINQLVDIDGTLWAIGGGYDEALDRETTFAYTSTDGITWEPLDLPQALGRGGHANYTATEAGLVAVVTTWEESTGQTRLNVFVSTDGATWEETDMSTLVSDDELMWINQVAGSGDVVVLTGAIEPNYDVSFEAPVITFEKDGYIIELDEETWSYLVTDAATGEVVVHGSQERLWGHSEEGYGIYDAVAGETIFAMGWEDLNEAGITSYESVQWGEPLLVTLTKDDRTLTLNEYTGVITVTDPSGAVLFTGTEHDLFQGPPPTFRDRDGEVLVVVPWDEWNAAFEAAYSATYPEFDGRYYAAPVMLRSADAGVSWQQVDVGAFASPGFHFQGIVAGPNGFLTLGTIGEFYDEGPQEPYGPPAPVVLTSVDGLTWTEIPNNLGEGGWIHNLVATPDGYMAVMGGHEGDSSVMASSDGSTWETVLTDDDLDLELGQVWFDRVSSGGLGTFVTGNYDGWTQPDVVPAYISRDGRTLAIEQGDYTVTDDSTGEVLFAFNEMDHVYFEELPVGSPPHGFKWGQGGIAMFDDEGGVFFAASHPQFEEAMSVVWGEPGVYYENETVLLYEDDGEWVRVQIPSDLGQYAWIGGTVVTDTSVVLNVTSETHSEPNFSIVNVAMVGVPAG